MKSIKNISKILYLILSSFLVGVGLITIIEYQISSDLKENWNQYTQEIDHKEVILSEVRGLIGYGGIIHSFKNYLLRKETKYLERAQKKIDELSLKLNEFENIALRG